jgi:hypothetical protein
MEFPLKAAVPLIGLGLLSAVAAGLWLGQTDRHEDMAQVKQETSVAGVELPAPAWSTDPARVDGSLPPVGRSLFDFLVMDGDSAKVPFPFEALTKMIDSRSGCTEVDRAAPKASSAAAGSCLKRVLIPLGRSLQRSAGAPDFFKYPRAVVAVDSEPPVAAGAGRNYLLLRDRLFLGYQEKAELIEVISYNEAAGRFEFQVVKDYRAGATPKVSYANRTVCVACHQNQAPLFSRQVWDETNANPRVAAMLMAQKPVFYGIPVARGVDIPNALDDATERANLFSVYQQLWREGCEDPQNRRKSTRCRAALLQALLQYRLNGERGFDETAPIYRNDLLALFDQSVKERWPGGLAIPNPDIPNRDPLLRAADDPGPVEGMMSVHVPARFDPLLPREPLEIWPADPADFANRTIVGLSQFVAAEDVQRLDHHLFAMGSAPERPRRTWSGNCRLAFSQLSALVRRLEFRCPETDDGSSALRLTGRIDFTARKGATGTVTRLGVPGTGRDIGDLDLRAERMEARRGQWTLAARALHDGRHARLTNGNAIEKISFRWQGAPAPERLPEGSVAELKGEVTVSALDDFAPVSAALAQLAADEGAGGDLLASKPFRRVAVLPALFARLGVPDGGWCCLDDRRMAPAQLDAGERTRQPTLAAAANFFHYCAVCHQTPERSPPNFLYGKPDQVAANLRHCAERIVFRLSMWRRAAGERSKTPMPPVLALKSLGVAPERWPNSAELAELERFAADMLSAGERGKPGIGGNLAANYESLPACLPPLESQRAAGGRAITAN